ncbi:tetratricopeptide repeat protein [Cystobacter fuscus]
MPLLLLLLAAGIARADAPAIQPGIQLYENGEYEAAAQVFLQLLADPQRSSQERGEARVYLAASLHAQGRVEETRQHLELLARENPEQQVDSVRFLPELVALAREIRQRVDAEREFARKEAERERLAREEALRRAPPPAWLRPEAFGLYEVLGPQWTVGAGLAYHRGLLEGGARVMLNRDPATDPPRLFPTFQLQGGVLPGRGLALGSGTLQPLVALRAILVPGTRSYGGGVVTGVRYKWANGLVALLDLGADYLFLTPDDGIYRNFAVTAQAGLGFDVRLSSGK